MLTPGQILKQRREELRKSLTSVSQETKIQERFLRYIENDDFGKFDSGVFVNGFIKIYAEYLGLDVERMLALYRRASKELENKGGGVGNGKKKKLDLKKFITPINVAVGVVTLALIGGLAYLNMQFYRFQSAPELEIVSPSNNQVVETDQVSVLGITDSNSEVLLNGESVPVNNDGSFEAGVTLKEGVNTFSITAINESNSEKETTKEIKLEYRKPQEKDEEPEEQTEYMARVQITGEAAWVRFIVDDEQKYAQVINPGSTEEFLATNSIEVVTGKPANTKLFINEKEYPLVNNPETGVASISCTINGNNLSCSQ